MVNLVAGQLKDIKRAIGGLEKLARVKTPEQFRDQILSYEKMLTDMPSHQVKLEVFQLFTPGLYIRRIRIPEGTVLTGKIHKESCYSMVLWGRMLVITSEGPKVVSGPCEFISPAGVKRAGMAITDCDWITVHPYNGPELSADEMADVFTVTQFEETEEQTA